MATLVGGSGWKARGGLQVANNFLDLNTYVMETYL